MICLALQPLGLTADQLFTGSRFAEHSLFDSLPIQQARQLGREVFLARIRTELSNTSPQPVTAPYHAVLEHDLHATYWRALRLERSDYFDWLNAIATATRPL